MVDVVYWIWLQQVFGTGTARSHQMMEEFSSPQELYEKMMNRTLPRDFLANREEAKAKEAMVQAQEIKRQTLAKQCAIITPDNQEYPPLLQHIYAKPAALYVKGDLTCLQTGFPITVVGTRHYSDYGKDVANSFAVGLATQNVVIVSGLAHGIDSIALAAAIKAGGHTVGVLACGLDIDYPSGSGALKTEIRKHGAVISEYPMGTKAIPPRFPPRNRVMAGMTRGVLVIEAGNTSGALITAGHALEYGREVFAVPGSIYTGKHTGSHQMIQQGKAKLVSTPVELLEEYPEYQNAEIVVEHVAKPTAKNTKIQSPPEPYHKKMPEGLEDAIYTVYAVVGAQRQTADQIAGKTDLAIAEVLSSLTVLEILGLVQSHLGGLFSLPAL